jgi:hypothetical protein
MAHEDPPLLYTYPYTTPHTGNNTSNKKNEYYKENKNKRLIVKTHKIEIY